MMLSSLIFNTIYSKTVAFSSTFFFLVMAAFYVVACILLLSVIINIPTVLPIGIFTSCIYYHSVFFVVMMTMTRT